MGDLEDRRILRRDEVLKICALSKTTMYAMIKAQRFPAPVRTGVRRVGWRQADVERWLDSLPSTTNSD